MSAVTVLDRNAKAKAAALQALAQMYGYYAFDWQPFTPALTGEKRAA